MYWPLGETNLKSQHPMWSIFTASPLSCAVRDPVLHISETIWKILAAANLLEEQTGRNLLVTRKKSERNDSFPSVLVAQAYCWSLLSTPLVQFPSMSIGQSKDTAVKDVQIFHIAIWGTYKRKGKLGQRGRVCPLPSWLGMPVRIIVQYFSDEFLFVL